jgi:hypothetical protein
VPKTKTPRKPKPLYRTRPPKKADRDFVHAEPISSAHFELREDGTIGAPASGTARSKKNVPAVLEAGAPHAIVPTSALRPLTSALPRLLHSSDIPFLRLYHGNSLELLDAIYAKYGDAGRFDAIFADPPT